MGVEPTCQPWEGRILPMNYTRVRRGIITNGKENFNTFLSTVLGLFPALTMPSARGTLELPNTGRLVDMDIKAKVEEIVEKIKSDKKIGEKFEKNPVSVIEELLGVDLPDDQVNQLVEAVKAKINLDKLGGALGGLFGKK